MAIAPPVIDYSASEFKQALIQILPPGNYWRNGELDSTLDKLLTALAEEFHLTYTETSNTLLFQPDKTLENWRVADFQALLDTAATGGQAFDDPNYPNIIFILLEQTTDFLATMQQMQAHRLPHTQINWKLAGVLGVKGIYRPTLYTRLVTQEA